jgi:hypothetical protein
MIDAVWAAGDVSAAPQAVAQRAPPPLGDGLRAGGRAARLLVELRGDQVGGVAHGRVHGGAPRGGNSIVHYQDLIDLIVPVPEGVGDHGTVTRS